MLASTLFFLVQVSLSFVAHASPIEPVRRLWPHSSDITHSDFPPTFRQTLGRRAVDGPGPYATYVVVLAAGVNLASHLAWLSQGIAENGGPESTLPTNAPVAPTDGSGAGGGMGDGSENGDSGDGSGSGGGAAGGGGSGGEEGGSDDGSGEGGDGSGGGGAGGGAGSGSGEEGGDDGSGEGGDGSGGAGGGAGGTGSGEGDDDAMSGPWDGPTGTSDGENAGVSWSDAGAGMYVAVLQGVLYEAVLTSPMVETVATDDDGQIAGGPLPGSQAKTFIQQQPKAPWNIARLSSNTSIAKPSTYYFNSTAGRGVDIYILDTGVMISHLQFAGRAKVGGNIGLGIVDGNGHGTFCASVAAGTTYGSAKKANIISIKTFSDSGGGTASSVIKGVALVFKLAKKSKRPSIISLSASFPANSALDAVVKKATKKGIHFVSAAGNAGADAGSYSPGRSPYSVTVGAVDSSDTIAKFSNTGVVVSLFAGGVNVLGAFIGNTAASATLSGTSMSTPAVAGLIAYFISTWGNAPPAKMAAALVKAATPNTIKGLKDGTVNLVAGNCRQFNDTCFDWSKPGKYMKPAAPPPPKPADPPPAKAAYDKNKLNSNQTQTRIAAQVTTTVRPGHPATIVSKGGAVFSRMTDHASETMTAQLAQMTSILNSTQAPLLSPSSSTVDLFHNLPIATTSTRQRSRRRSLFRYQWS
ncbi:hypothetical protein JCM3765_000292 [Sporobolomyces pararoseus]